MPEKNFPLQSKAKSSSKSKAGLGFYKRRRGILEHLEAGTISLLDLAVHDYLNLKANLVLGNGSSLPPGVCITSAPAIHATCPRGIGERAIQRSLEHLEEIGWIKRWNVRGKRGNYPVLVCRASVHDLSGNEYRVNGEATTGWRNPVLEPVGDLSALSSKADAKLSGDREVEVRAESKEERVSHDGPTGEISLTGKTWDRLSLLSLPQRYARFVDLVERTPLQPSEDLVAWGRCVLNLCAERSIEYPKVFLLRIKDAERSASKGNSEKTKDYRVDEAIYAA